MENPKKTSDTVYKLVESIACGFAVGVGCGVVGLIVWLLAFTFGNMPDYHTLYDLTYNLPIILAVLGFITGFIYALVIPPPSER